MDAMSLLMPDTKIAVRAGLDAIPLSISEAFRTAFYGRPGASFVDLPADVIQGVTTKSKQLKLFQLPHVQAPIRSVLQELPNS
jgi:2-hydroxyacyl-CoA lyase 1